MKKTCLFQQHIDAGGKMVSFADWEMPIHYGSLIEEHHAVRQAMGMFDVSHMCVVDIIGPEARPFLRYLLANDVDKLKKVGKALYTCMLNANGGIIDDMIVYRYTEQDYRIVVNAATAEKDVAWMQQHKQSFQVSLQVQTDFAIIAVQGPKAIDTVKQIVSDDVSESLTTLKPFNGVEHNNWWFARTGYTGEDGLEILLPQDEAAAFWQQLLDAGVKPCGLGSRDTLRLEAAMNLYGHDMDDTTSPLISGLAWTIAWEPDNRHFIGRELLQHEKDTGITQQLVGLILQDRGVLREGQRVITEHGDGVITSGTFSPTLQKSIALARIPTPMVANCQVEIRNKNLHAIVVTPPFVRKGQAVYKEEKSA
ncbi:MAG: aminomethyltransferase [marine bacterium B5-7]|nr:MAG: aminomethyltransferase [marine bacterium B5-7]